MNNLTQKVESLLDRNHPKDSGLVKARGNIKNHGSDKTPIAFKKSKIPEIFNAFRGIFF